MNWQRGTWILVVVIFELMDKFAIIEAQIVASTNLTFLCYSCISSPPMYAKFDDAALIQYLRQKRIRIPEMSQECREVEAWEVHKFKGISKYMCESGTCVKLKGMFQGEFYVVRECWERMWNQPLEEAMTMAECAPSETMWDTLTDVCACSGDLCNSSAKLGFNFLIVWILVLLFGLILM